MTGTLHEDLCTCTIISRSVLLIMRSASDKLVEKIKTHISCSITFYENGALCEAMWKKQGTARQATDHNIIWRMRFACWITEATDTHSSFLIHVAFPQPKWLRERATMLRYTYRACFVRSAIKIALLFFVRTYGVSAFCFIIFASCINYFRSPSISLYDVTCPAFWCLRKVPKSYY
jgi:hypothetical protein